MEMPTTKIDNPHIVGASTRYIDAEDRLRTQMDTTTEIDILIGKPDTLLDECFDFKRKTSK